MSIRSNNNTKNRLREKPVELAVVEEPTLVSSLENLLFRTAHPKKSTLVDLNVFRTGTVTDRKFGVSFSRPFSGRPELIDEMAPAIFDHLAPLAAKSVDQYIHCLRAWWRILDAIESELPDLPRVSSTLQFSDLHRQRALDQGMDRLVFSNFLLLANKTRSALRAKPLLWRTPSTVSRTRHLAPQWQTDLLRHELKHRWFAILDRWEFASTLTHSLAELTEDQRILLASYRRLDQIIDQTGNAVPDTSLLYGTLTRDEFYRSTSGLEVFRGRYPDGDDVRTAFHLCLATTGWNPAVLLSLDTSVPFIEPHPKDPGRYLLRGVKERGGGTEQLHEGLFKTRGGAGFIIQKLMDQTEPLRASLNIELAGVKNLLRSSTLTDDARRKLENSRARLERGIRSPWLFVSTNHTRISWLDDENFSKGLLQDVIEEINRRQPKDKKLAQIKPSDLRDAFAARVYHASGGSVLAVMKALNHRRVRSTTDYLSNSLLQEEHRKLFGTFSTALWHDIEKHDRVDPTILAKWSRDGKVTVEERGRLDQYRTLLRSRIGVGCKDPHNPPVRISPDFTPDGNALCSVQRCLLCTEHAVIFPDSLPGLCKRSAELRHLQMTMSVAAFSQSSFDEELSNIEIALQAFDRAATSLEIEKWGKRIADGTHIVIEFDGMSIAS